METRPPILDGELHLLLGDLKDDTTGYRRREATWISIVVHGIIVLALIFMPKWLPKSALIVPAHEKESAIFLESKENPNVPPPKTNVISERNNTAQSPKPTLDKNTLRRLLDERAAGPPKPASPPSQPPGGPQAMQAPPAPQAAQPAPAQPQPTEQARLEAPPVPKQNPFALHSAGSTVDRAIHSAAKDRTGPSVTFGGGEGGPGIRPNTDHRGAFEVLSDTRGVDFGPYLKRLKYVVQNHWDPLIPEVARPPLMKKGWLVIEFAIMKDGSIRGMRLIRGSGDTALDEAAWGALTSSIPLDKLPVDYSADYLLLRAAFYYNPDKSDLE